MSIEAMKQALDALERSVATCFDQYSHQQAMSQPAHFINQAIKSLRQAIAEAEKQVQNEPVGWIDSKGNMICTKINESCRPLYTHPQTKQEQGEPDDEVLGFNGWGFPIEHPPKPTPANKEQIREALVFNLPLYTTPQQRKPLTDEQIDEIADTVANMPLIGIVHDFRTRFARAIETAHCIKE